MRHAIVENGIVVNVIETPDGWRDPESRSLVQSERASKGDTYDGRDFTTPVADETPLTVEQVAYAALTTQATRIEHIARLLALLPPLPPPPPTVP